ncbi:MAG: glycine cleavage system protein T [Bdellovibrionaceae bacterium]|nr:glycine cleavage system protein T [Pseudobdellovibrionaceae bacterium]
MKKTPLYDEHLKLGARMVEFAGWAMPVQYKGLREEHDCVRSAVGLFDVSHMGEIFVRGEKALDCLEWLTTNHVAKLKAGEAHYTLLMNDKGGIVDDLIIYCIEPKLNYLVCANASNVEKDFQWISKHSQGADVTNESDQWAQIAVQGPKGVQLLSKVFDVDFDQKVGRFKFRPFQFQGAECLVARTGYTGEDGAEIFVPVEAAVGLWQQLLSLGEPFGVQACGLGARDTLRTEMKMSLYGHEIDDETNPYEAGLGWVVKPKDKDFLSKDIVLTAKQDGLKRKLVGFKMTERGIARHGYRIVDQQGAEIGLVTSGCPSPSLNENLGIGYVQATQAEVGQQIFIDIRNRRVAAEVVKTPFLKR